MTHARRTWSLSDQGLIGRSACVAICSIIKMDPTDHQIPVDEEFMYQLWFETYNHNYVELIFDGFLFRTWRGDYFVRLPNKEDQKLITCKEVMTT